MHRCSGAQRRRALLALLSLPAFSSHHGQALSQAYPTGTVKLVVPVAAGGATDTAGRFLASHLAASLGTSVIVENRPGASFVVGASYTARQRPDGHTLVLLSQTAAEVLPLIEKNLPYDTLRDFVPIIHALGFNFVLLVNPRSPAKSVVEFVEYAARQEGKLNYGDAGGGSMARLAMELLIARTGIRLQHISYQSEQHALVELMAGRLDAMFATVSTAIPQVREGKVRALGVPSKQRLSWAPDLQTFEEQGLKNIYVDSWFGVFAPAGTPDPIVQRLNRDLSRAISDPKNRSTLENMGFTPGGEGTAAEFRKRIVEETAAWRALVDKVNLKASD